MNAEPKFPHLIIRASAGTGKTFQLSNRFLGLLADGSPADHLLATTFTRKAAGEILDRVLVRLAEAGLDEQACQKLGQFIGQGALTCPRSQRLLVAVLRHLHRLQVSTLDSFFAQIARSFSLELGLPPGWQIVDELEDARLRGQAIEAVLQQNDAGELLTLMHLLTKGEANRSVAELIRATVNDLYDVFRETTAAAWQSIARHKPLDDGQLQQALGQLRSLPLPNGRFDKARDEDCERFESQDWEAFLSKGLANKVLTGSLEYYRKPIPGDAVELYGTLLQHVQAVLVGRLANQTEATWQLLEKFHIEYQRLKQERRALRFEDVTERLAGNLATAGAAAALGSVERLAFRLDSRVDHLLLDEFQDTAPPQWQVLRPFAERVTDGPGRSFFCVGDLKQAIYGWRGGVAEIFDAVGQQLPGLQQNSLNESYRSAQPVVDTVNRVFGGILKHPKLDRAEPAVGRWCQRFQQHSTALTTLAGYACLQTAPQAGEGEHAAEVTLRYAAEQVAALIGQAPGRSVGVLVRRNQTVGQLIYELRKLGVHASEEGGNPLTDSVAVRVVLSLLRLADHPADTVARFHLAHSPLGAALEFSDYRDARAARRLAEQVRRQVVQQGYGPAVYGWARALAPECSGRELSRLKQLVELAYGYQAGATLRVDDFVSYVQHQRVSDPTAADVRVMSVHQAKGLEFDIVVLPELETNLIGQPDSFVVHRADPTSPVDRVCRYANAQIQELLPEPVREMFTQATDQAVTEALCVLYVALTRAVHALHLIIPPSASNERSCPRTFAGLLRAALKDARPAPPQTTLYEHGNPEWFRQVEARPDTGRRAAEAAEAEPLVVRLAPLAEGRRRGLDRASPSSLEGGARVKLAQLFDPQQKAAMQRGTLIHTWFEQIRWLDDGPPEPQVLRQVAAKLLAQAEHDATTLDLNATLAQFHAMLETATIAGWLSRQAYQSPANLGLDPALQTLWQAEPLELEVHNECPFAVRDQDTILSGNIDRLVLVRQAGKLIAADILDFKTDTVSRETLDAKLNHYRPQIEAYRRAVARKFGLPPERITARLLFVGAGQMCSV